MLSSPESTNSQPRVLCPAKLPFTDDGETRTFISRTARLRLSLTFKPVIQKMYQGIPYTKEEERLSHKNTGKSTFYERKASTGENSKPARPSY